MRVLRTIYADIRQSAFGLYNILLGPGDEPFGADLRQSATFWRSNRSACLPSLLRNAPGNSPRTSRGLLDCSSSKVASVRGANGAPVKHCLACEISFKRTLVSALRNRSSSGSLLEALSRSDAPTPARSICFRAFSGKKARVHPNDVCPQSVTGQVEPESRRVAAHCRDSSACAGRRT